MTSDSVSFHSGEMSTPNHPLLVAQRANFQWIAALDVAALVAGWQEHLTDYLVAVATVSVSFEGQEPLPLVEVKRLDDPLDLYQITTNEQSVEIRVLYRSLSQAFMETPYDCHLFLRTEVGGRFVALPAPKPPSQAEWKQLVRKLWFQILLAGESMPLMVVDTTHPSAKGQPLYTFRLHPDLDWEESLFTGEAFSEWQRELRLAPDPTKPGIFRPQVGWAASQGASNQTGIGAREPESQRESGQTGKIGRQGGRRANSQEVASLSLAIIPLPTPERGRAFSRTRAVALTAAILLLTIIALVAVNAIRGMPEAKSSSLVLNPSPPLRSVPSGVVLPSPSPTAGSTGAPAMSPVPAPTAMPTPSGTPKPTSTPRPTPDPSPTAGTPTSPPTPTPTPSPTPTPTPTPAPVINFIVMPTALSQSCSGSPPVQPFTITLDNTGSNVPVSWMITITDQDPAMNTWATPSAWNGTVPAGQSATVTISPISTLCQDMAGASGNYTAVVSWQSSQATVTDAVTP